MPVSLKPNDEDRNDLEQLGQQLGLDKSNVLRLGLRVLRRTVNRKLEQQRDPRGLRKLLSREPRDPAEKAGQAPRPADTLQDTGALT
jgi:hypothetical protein